MHVTGQRHLTYNMKKILSTKEEKGFTLLFAVIVSTLVLAVGGSIINIALKQVVLSGIGRESQYAFYAASTGIECAYYWDIAGVNGASAFATSTGFNEDVLDAKCADTDDIYDKTAVDLDGAGFDVDYSNSPVVTSIFRLNKFKDIEGNDLDYCADVRVMKNIAPSGQVASTTIESRGYNTCDVNNPRRIERGLEMHY